MVNAAFMIAAVAARAANVKEPPMLDIPDLGVVQGRDALRPYVHDVDVFLGLPYAQAPVGELRWKSPQPHAGWNSSSPFNATEFGARCMQESSGNLSSSLFETPVSEDCLFINVAKPRAWAPGKGMPALPVVLFVHGGGYTAGASNSYAIDALVQASNHSVVVASINYRLGLLGFLGSESLRVDNTNAAMGGSRSGRGSTGNYGIEDQALALRWVRQHIGAFGGDRERVTLFGDSAGGDSVVQHMVQPRSRGLFHRAIIASGAWSSGGIGMGEAEARFGAVAEQHGCNAVGSAVGSAGAGAGGANAGGDGHADAAAAAVVACLRGVSAAQLVSSAHTRLPPPRDGDMCPHKPVVDGVWLLDHPPALIARGEYHAKDVPVVLGSATDEAAFFFLGPASRSPFARMFPAGVGKAQFYAAMGKLAGRAARGFGTGTGTGTGTGRSENSTSTGTGTGRSKSSTSAGTGTSTTTSKATATAAAAATVAALDRLYTRGHEGYDYPARLPPYSEWWWKAQRIAGDRKGLGACAPRALARALRASRAGGGGGVFLYDFAHATQSPAYLPGAGLPGGSVSVAGSGPGSAVVPHTSYLPYMFGEAGAMAMATAAPGGSAGSAVAAEAAWAEAALAAGMARYWAAFAASGNPNPDPNALGAAPLPTWPEYALAGEDPDTLLRFKAAGEGDIHELQGFRKAQCDFHYR